MYALYVEKSAHVCTVCREVNTCTVCREVVQRKTKQKNVVQREFKEKKLNVVHQFNWFRCRFGLLSFRV